MPVPLFDPQPQHAVVGVEVEQAVLQVLQSGQYILGPAQQQFATQAANLLDSAHAIGVASGTDALHLALRAADIGPGDEVITPAFTFAATVEAILYCGATPVFADIDPVSLNLCPTATAQAISTRTKAILPVHLFGLPAELAALHELATEHGLWLIEDCAQSFGATVQGRPTGSWGDFGCFSFFPTKNLGGYGDGGLVTTQSEAAAERLKVLRNHGSRQRYEHHELGYNSRLDDVQAAALAVKLQYLPDFNAQRQQAASWYCQHLQDTPLQLPPTPTNATHVYGQFTVRAPQRDHLHQYLHQHGIGAAVYYPIPLHRQPLCAAMVDSELSLPVTEQVTADCLSLPMFPGISETQVQEVVRAVRSFYEGTQAD